MVGIVLLVVATVVCLAYLAQPLVVENVDGPWKQFDSDNNPSTETEKQTPTRPSNSSGQQAMTDGGRVCHNCGSYVEGDYLYCAECLIPRV